MKNVKIIFFGEASKFTFGIVENEDEINLIKESISDSDKLGINLGDFDSGNVVLYENYVQLFHEYGFLKDCMEITCTDEDEINITDKINYFTIDTPFLPEPEELIEEYGDKIILWGVENKEKRTSLEINLKVLKSEEFNVSDLYCGVINLEELFYEAELIKLILLINEKDKEDIIKNLIEEEFLEDSNDHEDFLTILSDNYIDAKHIFKKYELEFEMEPGIPYDYSSVVLDQSFYELYCDFS